MTQSNGDLFIATSKTEQQTDSKDTIVKPADHPRKIQKSKSEDIPGNENYESDYYTPVGSFESAKPMSTAPENGTESNIRSRTEVSPRHHSRVRHRSDGNLVYENKDVLDSVQEILMEDEKEWKRVNIFNNIA